MNEEKEITASTKEKKSDGIEKTTGVKGMFTRNKSIIPIVGLFFALCFLVCIELVQMLLGSIFFGMEAGISFVMEDLRFTFLITVLPWVLWVLPYGIIFTLLGAAVLTERSSIMWIKEAMGRFWFGLVGLMCFLWGIIASTNLLFNAIAFPYSQIDFSDGQYYILKASLILIVVIIVISGFKRGNLFSVPVFKGGHRIWLKTLLKAFGFAFFFVILLCSLQVIASWGSLGTGGWTYWETGSGEEEVFTASEPNQLFLFIVFLVSVLFFIPAAVLGIWAIIRICFVFIDKFWGAIAYDQGTSQSQEKPLEKRRKLMVGFFLAAVAFFVMFQVWVQHFGLLLIGFISVLVIISRRILIGKGKKEEMPSMAFGKKSRYVVLAFSCLLFCLYSVLTEGTDIFLIDLGIMILLPVVYIIGIWLWEKIMMRNKSQMANDVQTAETLTQKKGFRNFAGLGIYYLSFGLLGILGRLFLEWYERDWMENDWTDWEGIENEYEQMYGSGLFANYDLMLNCILGIGIGAAVVGITLLIVGNREKQKRKTRIAL